MTPSAAPGWPTAATRPVVLLGWPARHSLSPPMHNAAFRALELDLVYLAAPTPPARLEEVVAALGTIGALGANVTVPHKRAVVAACDQVSDEASLIGAVNTLTWTEDGLHGDNTDAEGLRSALERELAPSPGDRWVLVGTGGAARAAAVAIARTRGQLTVAGRRASSAAEVAELATLAGASDVEVVVIDDDPALAGAVGSARVVVNATPLGMAGEPLPGAAMHLDRGQVAYDLVYDPADTPFLAAAMTRGAAAFHGLGMLVGQATGSFTRWTGVPAPLQVMEEAALAALDARRQVPRLK